MSNTQAEWHPASEVPIEGSIFYTTAEDKNGNPFTTLGFYNDEFECWFDTLGYELHVVAWREITEFPEPYKAESE